MDEDWPDEYIKRDIVRVVRRLLDPSADVNERDDQGNTDLHSAASFRDRNIVETLLKRDADHSLVNNYGLTPLFMAVSPNYLMEDTYTHPNQLPIIRMLLNEGADVNVADTKGTTPLMVAAMGFSLDLLKVLLEAGADVHRKDYRNDTCLHYLCRRPVKTNMMRELVMAGANPLGQNDSGKHALHIIMDSNNRSDRQKVEEVKELMKVSTLVKHSEKLNFPIIESLDGFGDECYLEVQKMSFVTLSRGWTLRDFALYGTGQKPKKIVCVAFEKWMEQNISIYNDYVASHFDQSYLVDKLMVEGIIVYSMTGLTDVKLRDYVVFDFCKYLSKTDIYNLLKVIFISKNARVLY